LEQAIGKSSSSKSSLGVLFIDVDRFKVIDSLGHPAGIEMLKAMAQRTGDLMIDPLS